MSAKALLEHSVSVAPRLEFAADDEQSERGAPRRRSRVLTAVFLGSMAAAVWLPAAMICKPY